MNERKPLVSFILTYYNLPVELLTACINSILALSLQPAEREIIVVDDGSDSSPMNELMAYGSDIIYIRKDNGGLSTARNKGIEIASGEYIQFVDADDRLLTAPYEHCLNIVRGDKEVDVLLFDFTHQPTVDMMPTQETPKVMSGAEFMRHHNLHGMACGYLFRSSTCGDLRFTPGIYHEDEEFTPQLLLRAEKVCATSQKAYYYNKRQGSITTHTDEAHAEKRLKDHLYVIRSLAATADHLPHNDRLAIERRIHQLAMDYIYKSIVEKRSLPSVEEHLDELKSLCLYPLPDRNYTAKYNWFRRMTNSKIGLTLLTQILPRIRKER